MNQIQQLLTENIGLWTGADTAKKTGRGRASGSAGAVYGIKKLRELILELAVRGKLVPQDVNDEPGSVLLERIRAEKARLIFDGKIKKDKPLAAIADDEKPFELPQGWTWVRFGDALISRDAERIPVSSDIRQFQKKEYDYYGASGVIDQVDGYIFDKPLLLIGEDGANLINRSTPIAFIARGKYWVNNHAHVLDGVSENFLQYIELYVNAIDLKPYVTGTAQPKMNQAKMNSIVLGLPPEKEGAHIVTKVNELMALCDRLEAGHVDAVDAHGKLVSHLLATLTASQDSADFSSAWQRIAVYFDMLFTTEASIDTLKQTLLQLAVMGKLVPQDPSEEPASTLLERIQAEKAKLVFEGQIKKDKLLPAISDEEKPFELPQGWEWVRLDQLSHVGTGATPLRTNPEYFDPPAINWVTSGETSSSHIFETVQYVSPLAIKETNLTVYPSGTLIVAMYGQGKTRGQITELMIDACTNQACAAISLFNREIHHRKYVKLFFVKIYDEIRELAAGGAQPNLNLSKIKETLLPLPPISEQARIVAKIDELMALCDQIKERISNADALQRKLADVMVAQAVA